MARRRPETVVTMSRAHPKSTRARFGLSALLAAASAVAMLRALPALAQESDLRSFVSDSAISEDQQKKTRQISIASGQAQTGTQAKATPPDRQPTTYQPISPGAVPDNPAPNAAAGSGSIFDQPAATGDPFADDPAPLPRRRPASQKQDKAAAQAKAASNQSRKPEQDKGQEPEPDAAKDYLRTSTVDAADKEPVDPRAERTGSIEGRDKPAEENPFEAPGVRVGSFILRPALEQGVTASSNPNASSGGAAGILSETTLRLNAVSDWRGNSASLDAYGTVRRSLSGAEIKDARGRIEGALNVDLENDLRAVARLGYEAAPESASSPVVIVDTVTQPLRQSIDGSLGLEKDFGKLRLGLTGTAQHDSYGDAELSSGGTLSQKDRNSTLYTATLRTGYEISPALTPFAEVEVGRRLYDQKVDSAGYERSSNRLGASVGLQLDLDEKLTGEFSAGWLRESFDDDRLAPVSGATVNADLRWSPERGTLVTMNGQTTVEDTTTAGESGSILYSGKISVDRQIRANLTGNAAFGAGWRDYTGSDDHDLILSAEAGLTWWLNRYAGLTTRVRTEKQSSNLPGRDYTANSVFLGLRLQR